MSNRLFDNILLVSSVVLIAIFNLILAKYATPLTEGWWELFAKQSLKIDLYKDIYIGLPPLYINFIQFLQKFTYNIFELRLFFNIIHTLEFLLLVYLLKQYFQKRSAIFGALISELLIIVYNTAYLPKDYHLFLSVIVILALIGVNKYVTKNRQIISLIFLGLLTGLLILVKQNIALVITISIILTIILKNTQSVRLVLIHFFLYSFLILSVIYFYSIIENYNWIAVYLGNDSKGSPIKVLTRILLEPITVSTFIQLSICLILIILKSSTNNKHFFFKLNENIQRFFINNDINIWNLILGILFIYFSIRISQNKDFTIIAGSIFCYLIISLFIKKDYFGIKNISIFLLLLNYANSMTAGLNFVGMQYSFAFLFAIIFGVLEKFNKRILLIYAMIILSILTFNFYKDKVNKNLYNWWGYKIGSVQDAIFESSNKYLKGLKLNEDTSVILNKVEYILSKGDNTSTYYFYPNIPLFYYIFDIQDMSKFPISWFDVIPSSMEKEFLNQFIKINPEYIFWLKPPFSVYQGHRKLKGSDSVMSAMDDEIMRLISSGKYEQIYIRPLGYLNIYGESIVDFVSCELCLANAKEFNRFIMDNNMRIENLPHENWYKIFLSSGVSLIKFYEKFNPISLNSENFNFIILKRKF